MQRPTWQRSQAQAAELDAPKGMGLVAVGEGTVMRTADLAGCHPRIKRPPDPLQDDLFAKPVPLVMNVVSWRDAAAGVAMLPRMRQQQPERPRPTLRVIEGGHGQFIDAIKQLAEELRQIEQRLASAHEELGRLLALLLER